ncbi:hypothetical protein THRCLA_22192 [Thraustotheca clavata]|uniref:Elicitin n=1 Tax=Thraustotheca clavata TaxID=74557 RepID=A0A1V9ZAK8_9STRA|nr:hypothetical protein THRCLA_22192 [Thraustotheca clavata]
MAMIKRMIVLIVVLCVLANSSADHAVSCKVVNTQTYYDGLVALVKDPSVAQCMNDTNGMAMPSSITANQLTAFLNSSSCQIVYGKLMDLYNSSLLPHCSMDQNGTMLQSLSSWNFTIFNEFYSAFLPRLP